MKLIYCLNEVTQKEIQLSALSKVKQLVTVGSNLDIAPFTTDEIEYLSKTVIKNKNYILYRGIAINKDNVPGTLFDQYKQLKKGDQMPDTLLKRSNQYVSYTKKLKSAKFYADGDISILIKSIVPFKNVIVDLERIEMIIKDMDQHIISFDDIEYFKSDKECIIMEYLPGSFIFSRKG